MVSMVGCHRMNVAEVTSNLRIGMSKMELDVVTQDEKFLKEQVVMVRPRSTEEDTRAAVWSNKTYELVYPKDLIQDQLPFDGSVKAYSYLIKEERSFANPVYVDALVVFFNEKKGEVVGWAVVNGLIEVRLWHDFF